MAESLSRYTPRQIADAIVCALIDAQDDWKTQDESHEASAYRLALGTVVLDTLKDMRVAFVDGTADYWGGK